MKTIEILEETLKDLYVNKQMSTRDIAKHLGVGQTTVRRLMAKYSIKARANKKSRNTNVYRQKLNTLANHYRKIYTKASIENGSRVVKICPICGKSFEDLKSSKKVYCSKQCFGISIRKQNTCNVCGKVLDNHWAKYCPECLHSIKSQTNRVCVTCAWCGKELNIIPSVYTKFHNHYCNVECMANYFAENYTGENSPTWKGGKRHYKGHWIRQRNLARKRDNYTCQLCGVTESEWHKEMDVHHIKNYRTFENKEEANSLDNLVCLCNQCHSFIHSNLNTDKWFLLE